MILKTAWKNIWRKKTRSLIIILSVVIGIFAGVFSVALMNGLVKQRVDAGLNTEISHIQINHKKYRENYDAKYKIANTDSILNIVKNVQGISSIARRTVISGMVSTTEKNTGVQIVGINPEEELKVFNLKDYNMDEAGSYFDSKINKANRVYIGESLAKELNIIRYKVKEEHIEELRILEVPEEIIIRFKPLVNNNYRNEKLFKKAVKQIFNDTEVAEYFEAFTHVSKEIRTRAKLVLTFLDKDNVQTGGRFRIAGMYNMDNNLYERTQIFVLNSDLKNLAGVEEEDYHQLIVRLNDVDSTNIVKSNIEALIPGLQVQTWKEISPELAMTTDLVKQFYAVFMMIILAALAFGILNTMLMVVLERTKELGMLTAIGMNKRKVFSMIMLESVMLSLLGGLFGMGLSKLIINLASVNGIDLSFYAASFEELGYASLIYPEIDGGFFIIVTVMIIITGILSAIYPAYKALKLNPSDAIRTE